jgi:hypothetical protein
LNLGAFLLFFWKLVPLYTLLEAVQLRSEADF